MQDLPEPLALNFLRDHAPLAAVTLCIEVPRIYIMPVMWPGVVYDLTMPLQGGHSLDPIHADIGSYVGYGNSF